MDDTAKVALPVRRSGSHTAAVVGDGCCPVVPAEDAITEQMLGWRGARTVPVNTAEGLIDGDLDAAGGPAPEDLIGIVQALGYRVETVDQLVGR